MLKLIITLGSTFFLLRLSTFGQRSKLKGQVYDCVYDNCIHSVGVSMYLYDSLGMFLDSTYTRLGKYQFGTEPGSYQVLFNHPSLPDKKITQVVVNSNKITFWDCKFPVEPSKARKKTKKQELRRKEKLAIQRTRMRRKK